MIESTQAMNEQAFVHELQEYNRKLRECEEQVCGLQEEVRRLQSESIFEQETKLYSPSYFHVRLQEELIRSERYRHFLSLVLVHVEVRNAQSTQQITRELTRVGQEMMLSLSRRTDLVAYYQRRQIVIMLPETDGRGVATLLGRSRAMFPQNGRRLNYSVLTYSQRCFQHRNGPHAPAANVRRPLPRPGQPEHLALRLFAFFNHEKH